MAKSKTDDTSPLDALLPALNALAEVLSHVSALGAAVSPVIVLMGGFGKIIQQTNDAQTKRLADAKALSDVADGLAKKAAQAQQDFIDASKLAAANLGGPLQASTVAAAAEQGKAARAAQGLADAAQGTADTAATAGATLAEGLSVVAGAAGAAVGALEALVNVSTQFAGLLSPTLLQVFNTALKDLQATVGVALLPVLQAAAGATREFGELLLPAMRELAPVVAEIANIMRGQLSVEMQVVVAVVRALIPVLSAVSSIMAVTTEITKGLLSALVPIITAIGTNFSQLAGVIKIIMAPLQVIFAILSDVQRVASAFGTALQAVFASFNPLGKVVGGVAGAMDGLRGGFQALLKAVVIVGAGLIKLFGGSLGDQFLKEFSTALQGGQTASNRGIRPAEQAQFVDIAQIGKNIALAASMASPGSVDKSDSEIFKQLAKTVDDIRTGKTDVNKALEKLLLEDVPAAIAKALVAVLKPDVYKQYEEARKQPLFQAPSLDRGKENLRKTWELISGS